MVKSFQKIDWFRLNAFGMFTPSARWVSLSGDVLLGSQNPSEDNSKNGVDMGIIPVVRKKYVRKR